MHNNPVKCGLVKAPGDWPWSSWRFYLETIPKRGLRGQLFLLDLGVDRGFHSWLPANEVISKDAIQRTGSHL